MVEQRNLDTKVIDAISLENSQPLVDELERLPMVGFA